LLLNYSKNKDVVAPFVKAKNPAVMVVGAWIMITLAAIVQEMVLVKAVLSVFAGYCATAAILVWGTPVMTQKY
jgi:hypothetical protein